VRQLRAVLSASGAIHHRDDVMPERFNCNNVWCTLGNAVDSIKFRDKVDAACGHTTT
jgi:hypothetical protein